MIIWWRVLEKRWRLAKIWWRLAIKTRHQIFKTRCLSIYTTQKPKEPTLPTLPTPEPGAGSVGSVGCFGFWVVYIGRRRVLKIWWRVLIARRHFFSKTRHLFSKTRCLFSARSLRGKRARKNTSPILRLSLAFAH